MLNDVPAQAAARRPRGLVKINGEIVEGWVAWEVDNNTFYAADTYRMQFAVSAMDKNHGPDWWAAQSEIIVEIFAGFPADPENYSATDLQSLIYGLVDEVNYDPVSATIDLYGRDLTAKLIDTKTTEKYRNMTASQIATALASKYELNPVVTATKEKAGRYYDLDHDRMTDERSEWDLLTYLAHEEGFAVYVKGRDLHFEPVPSESQDPYVLQWESATDDRGYAIFNGKNIAFSRNLTLARGVTVTVRSWNIKQKKAFNVTYPTHKAKGTAPGQSNARTQNYYFTRPNLTPEECLKLAMAKHREISQHEMRMTATLPADNILGVKDVIQVTGTESAFDQIYYPDSIVRRMSVSDGYLMTITAKNVNPENIVVG